MGVFGFSQLVCLLILYPDLMHINQGTVLSFSYICWLIMSFDRLSVTLKLYHFEPEIFARDL